MLKYTAQPEKRDVVMKNGNEVRDVLGDSQKRYRYPWVEKGKYRPRYEPIRLHDSLPGPLRKKNESKYQPWAGTFSCIPATLIRLDVVTNYII